MNIFVPDPSDASDHELDLLIEGDLSVDAAQALFARMKSDSGLLARYLEKVRVDSLLRDRNWREVEVKKTTPKIRWGFWTSRNLGGLAAAAVFLLCVSAWLWRPRPVSKPVAGVAAAPTLTFTPSAVFETTASSLSGDGQLRFGDGVVMNDGTVSIRLPSGAEAIIKSPARFAITASNRLKLSSGAGWFRVPPEARGFTVETPNLEVVDLGTIFSVTAANDADRVQVRQGRVEVHLKGATLPVKALGAGESLSRQASGEISISMTDLPFEPNVDSEKEEIVFREVLDYVPDQSFAERKPLIGSWAVQEGKVEVRNGRFNAQSEFTHLMGRFSRPIEPTEDAVILLSFKSVSPKSLFHSKGFAGVSLFDGDGELFFLGDKSTDSYSWELLSYGKYYRGPRQQRRAYDLAIQGSEETFTFRYRQRTGWFEVFRGWGVRGVPIVQAQTDPGLRFDGVRVANGRGGDFSFTEMQVSVIRQSGN